MKNHLKIAAFAIAMFGFSAASYAQVSETQTATAEVVKALSFKASSAMDFAKVTPAATGTSTVVLAAGGGTSGTAQAFGTATPASFTVNGEPSAVIVITLPATATDYTLTNTDGTLTGTVTMPVNAFTSNAGATPTLDATTGDFTFSVGATLNLDATQVAGTYANTNGFQVSVDYQ